MADIYCKVCGEPWDSFEVRDSFSEEEKKQFFGGKGCPCCHGVETYYCENCDRFFKAWMDFSEDFPGLEEDIKKMIWKDHKCPYCLGKLKKAVFVKEFFGSLVSHDGEIEDVIKVNVLDFI